MKKSLHVYRAKCRNSCIGARHVACQSWIRIPLAQNEEIRELEFERQPIYIENLLETWLGPKEEIRTLELGMQPLCADCWL